LHRAVDLGAASPGRFVRAFPKLGLKTSASVSLRMQVIAASILLSVLVTGTFAVLLIAMSDLKSSTNAQTRSKDVTTATLNLQRVVNQLELSLRAFTLSDNKHFVAQWRQAERDLAPAILGVEKLVVDQPREHKDVNRLAAQVEAFVREYGSPLIKIAALSPEAARSAVATREGVFRIQAIRNSLSELLNREDAAATARSTSAKREARRAVLVGIGALVAMGAMLVAFGFFLARGIARPVRNVAEGAARVASGDLSTRLPERGAAELQQLTKSFNAMARSLAQGKRELESQNEQLRQSERLKSELVSIVSHELRTPLASILGYSSLLLKRDFGREDTRRYLEVVQAQGNRLASLVEEFLDVERVEAGRIALRDDPIDLKPILLEEARLISTEAQSHRIDVSINAETLSVRGDRDRIAQVFANLLANAIKYSPDGGLVEVTGDVNGKFVRVQVRDEGIGIPDEHQARIFTKFFRGEARERGFVGTGLGLAVSREIVEAHGGRVGFTSAPGQGSTFWFELPLTHD
jgi:signal transduction histidine kinase